MAPPACSHGTLLVGDPPIGVDRVITVREHGGVHPCDRCGQMAARRASVLLRRGNAIAALGLCGPCVAELAAVGLQAAFNAGELETCVARFGTVRPRLPNCPGWSP